MIIGDPQTLAIESDVTEIYENQGLKALGYFVLHVGGQRYGVNEPGATMLANSFDKVGLRLVGRGKHSAPFALHDAHEVATGVLTALFDPPSGKGGLLGLTPEELLQVIYDKHLLWAPDGDEAFDDGSYVLQFDCADRIRLIAFRRGADTVGISDLKDISMPSDDYYLTLSRWYQAFEAYWKASLSPTQQPPN